MRISEICRRGVVTCGRDASAIDMAGLMRDQHVGDLIVIDTSAGKAIPVGIVTDRDLVAKVVALGVDAAHVTAADLMSEMLTSVLESESVYDAIWCMRSQGVRRLPVVDAQRALVGVLTVDDVTEFLAKELTDVAYIAPRQIRLEQSVLELAAG